MSEENVEAVRAAYEHFNRTGEPRWELFHPDAVFDASNILGLVIRGRERLLASMRDYAAGWERWEIEPEEFHDAGEQVVTAFAMEAVSRAQATSSTNAHLWTFEPGKVVRWRTFTERTKALEVAGLSE